MKTTKHDHKGTNKLKVIILSLFLLMPFICFIPTAFYYGLNEHATAQTKEVVNFYNSSTPSERYDAYNLQEHTTYNLSLNDTTGHISDSNLYYFEYLDFVSTYWEQYLESSVNYYAIKFDSNDYVYIYTPNYEILLNQTDFEMKSIVLIIVIDNSLNQNTDIGNYLDDWVADYNITGTNIQIPNGENSTYTMSIVDSMSQAWTDTWSNPIFNWVNTNPLKTNIDGFVNWFGITNNALIPQYLTYIISIVGIYIVIDIILVLYTKLTHMFSKEHE